MKRFAIKFPDGTYSKGAKNGRTTPVTFDKAKLWTNIGHVKNHLNGLPNKAYPRGSQIVEVVITHIETPLMSVGAALDQAQLREDQRRAEIAVRNARWRLAEAQRKAQRAPHDPITQAQEELDKALAKAEKLGVKL